jgi:Ca-activated chloride channel family protein
MYEALKAALQLQPQEEGRPFMIVFLTDGQPTVGEIQTEAQLVDYVKKRARGNTRLFVFGLGYDVNTHLLDKMALQNRGDRSYVYPDEDLELKISLFYQKVAHPVISDVKVNIDGIETYDVMPGQLSDLFRGSQLVIYGRYKGAGSKAIKVSGTVNGRPVEFVYEVTFPEQAEEHVHIPRLWATARVGYLLDQLRLKGIKVASGQMPKGPEKELVDEIIRLATRYGIVTPYTALLVVEDSRRPGRPITPLHRRLREEQRGRGGGKFQGAMKEALKGLGQAVGREAVNAARAARKMRSGYFDKAAGELGHALRLEQTIRSIEGKTFVLVNGIWYDTEYREGMKTTKVKFLSEEYFQLVVKFPKLARYLSLGKRVIVCLGEQVYEVTAD